MNCHEYEASLMDLARAQSIDGEERKALLAHLDVCSYCQRRFSNHRALTEGLFALAQSNRSLQASERLESSLLDSYRQRQRFAARSRRAIAWISAAAAAGVVILFALRSPIAPDSSLSGTTAKMEQTHPVVSTPPAASVEQQSNTGPVPSASGKQVPRTRQVNRQMAEAELAYFLPLDDYEPIEMGVVVRVQLPQSLFGSPGTALDEDQRGQPIEADILIGEDGSARAIRFVLE
jgi:hypothetical protein